MKADDDTYVILENLRYLLSDQDKNKPLFFGLENVRHEQHPFMSGGAGMDRVKMDLTSQYIGYQICRHSSKTTNQS